MKLIHQLPKAPVTQLATCWQPPCDHHFRQLQGGHRWGRKAVTDWSLPGCRGHTKVARTNGHKEVFLLHVKTLWDKIDHRKVPLRSGTGGQLAGDWLKISGGAVVVTDNPRTVWSLIFMDSSHPPISNQSPAAQWLVADWLPIDLQLKKGSLDCMVVAMVAAVFYH